MWTPKIRGEVRIAAYRCTIQAEVAAITNQTSDTGNLLLTLTVNDSYATFTRTDGSFLDDGFAVRNLVETTGFKHKGNNRYHNVVVGVTDQVLRVSFPKGMKDEEAVARIHAIGGGIDLPFD